jgi:hypothetical protein
MFATMNRFTVASLDFCVLHFGFRIFRTARRDIVSDCFKYAGFSLPSELLPSRSQQFSDNFGVIDIFVRCVVTILPVSLLLAGNKAVCITNY